MSRSRDVAQILGKTDAANSDNHALLNTSSGVDSAEVITLVTAHSSNVDSADIQIISAPLTNRNLIINGAMQVSQRGTSFTSTADSYTLDRFALGHGSPVNACTTEQSTDAPANFKYSMKVTAGTGASAGTTGYASLRQAIEGQNIAHVNFGTSAAKNITLSFWVKCSLTGNFGTNIRNQAGNRAYASIYTINSANTWEYKTVTIPADTGGTWPTDNGIGFHIQWDLGAGSNYDIAAGSWTDGTNMFGVEGTVKLTETTNATWQMTGVQLEIGDVATPFEHEDVGTTLRKCQRYYQSMDYTFDHGTTSSNIFYYTNFSFPITMRATPTMTASAYGSNTGNATTQYGSTSSNGWIMQSAIPTGCFIRGNHANIYNQMVGRGKFDAEL